MTAPPRRRIVTGPCGHRQPVPADATAYDCEGCHKLHRLRPRPPAPAAARPLSPPAARQPPVPQPAPLHPPQWAPGQPIRPYAPPPARPTRTGRFRFTWWEFVTAGVVAVVALFVAIALGSGGNGPGGSSTVDLKGVLDLNQGDTGNVGDTCSGSNGYDDIQQGAEVTISDQSGTVIGTTTLDAGALTEATGSGLVCEFPFSLSGLPSASFYQIQVTHRGNVTFPQDQMGNVTITLGTGS